MEFLEKIGDWFVGFTGAAERFITRLFGSSNEKRVKKIGFLREKKTGESSIIPGSALDRINQLEPQFEKLTDDELKQTAGKFRDRIAQGQTLDQILPEAFAAVRESSKRYLKMRHYDVQMVGGYILHQGMIAEMVTGEGKTLVGTLPAFLNALVGKVHLVTVNDYLALRDMEWMGPVHMGLGLKVGAIQSSMSPWERHPHYACDITYGTNNEFGFDYLRDNMKRSRQEQAQGPLDFAIVDEIDNILIDEARTPLIISGSAHDDVTKYPKANKIALQLKRDVDFEVKEKEHTCHLTEGGVRRAEELAGVESFYTVGNMEWPHLIDNALKAHYLYKRDHQYMVRNGEVIIVDEHTGRAMEGRQWSDGLHQAVEAKEGVKVKEETQTYATITLQNFFKLYKKLAGMTGTAMTEASEFLKIYNLDVVAVPTNRPLKRVNFPDLVYCTEREKWDAVAKEVVEVHKTGRPILVGTVSIEKSEYLSGRLDRNGIKHNVLNAKHVEREAELIAQAGRLNAVTIATNMAGRGTDIILGGNPENAAWEQLKRTYRSRLDVPKAEWDSVTKQIAESEGMKEEGRKVEELGGLHVVGTERHDSRRIDLQLRGRAGRQGDHGSSRFFVSLEDDLMRLFGGDRVKGLLRTLGMAEGEAIESPMVTRRIEAAQKKREETHFDQRKNLLEYDEVMDDQRKRVYGYRQQILDGANCRDRIMEMIEKQVRQATEVLLDRNYRWESIAGWARQEQMVEIDASTIRDMEQEQLTQFIKDELLSQADELIQEKLVETLPEEVDPKDWSWQALSQWFNFHYTENTNAGELKKQGRDDLHNYLYHRAKDAVERREFKALDIFLKPDYPVRALCSWANQQFTLELRPEEVQVETPEQAAELLMTRLTALYREKEIAFPVAVGVNQYMTRQVNDKENLINWANLRFQSKLDAENVKNKQRKEIEQLLHDASRQYFVNGDVTGKVDEYLDEAFHDRNGHTPEGKDPQATAALGQLAHWANQEFHCQLEPGDFESLTRTEAREKVIHEYESRYRPELARAERAVILEFLDTAWKEHLYYMDHLRSGIGLVGYAQKDAKVEYKREGKKAFESMWDRIEQNVTSAIFRLEKDSPDYVGHLWDASSATKSAPPADTNVPVEAASANNSNTTRSGGESQVVDPIRNYGDKVGRNDLCPCGSGKKFKKCHGA